MRRDVDPLSRSPFDLLVVGGGIYGLTIAYDGAQRGLSVALVERGDFGSGTSFNHLRTIHGGLRYLQTLDVGRARESVGERRTLARIAPHMVRPLPFVLPLTRSLTKGKLAMRAGFLLDRLVACDRNRGVPSSHHLTGGRVVSREEANQRFPGLPRRGLTGAALWHDYVTTEPDRLTFSYALAAERHGAVLANYVEAAAPLVEGARVVGVRALDRVGGLPVDIRARVTVNATGAALDRLLRPLATSAHVPLLRALNVVTTRLAGQEALGARSAAGRLLFLVPWNGRALFGTWESATTCGPDDLAVSDQELEAFLAELNRTFPALDLTREEVTLVHRGLVPAVVNSKGRPELEGHEQVRDHAAQSPPIEGLISVAGAKYTTARAVAARITDKVFEKLRRPAVSCHTADTPLPGGDVGDVDLAVAAARRAYGAGLRADVIPHLVAAYGSRYGEILNLETARPDLREALSEDSPVIGAELAWAARFESVVHLSDAVLRRTSLGALGYPGDACAERAAAIVGSELGWSRERARGEVDLLRAFYRPDVV